MNNPHQGSAHDELVCTRRQFVKTSAAIAAIALTAPSLVTAQQTRSANQKLNLAFIGVGGRGADNMRELTKFDDVNVVALCDVDSDHLDQAAQHFSKAARGRDYREMLQQKANDIDAVIVSVPDHSHAPAAMMALKLGKHVYCEKPLTKTVFEAREITKAARAAGVATQMGNQGMAFEGNRQLKEWLADGVIGQVREAHVWSDRPTHSGKLPLWWPQGVERPTDNPRVPSNLDWQLWLGPAPERPYHPDYGPFKWRGWWDFGNGGLGDMGIHNLAPVFDALKLAAPESVHATSTALYPDSIPIASLVHYQFPEREGRAAIKLHWYDGGLAPARPVELDDELPMSRVDGIILVGDEGKILIEGWGGNKPTLLPLRRDKEYKRPAPTLPRSVGHHREWLDACKNGGHTMSNFEFAGPLTEAVLLGAVCVRLGGEKLIWNSQQLEVVDNPAATALLHYEYRTGWQL